MRALPVRKGEDRHFCPDGCLYPFKYAEAVVFLDFTTQEYAQELACLKEWYEQGDFDHQPLL